MLTVTANSQGCGVPQTPATHDKNKDVPDRYLALIRVFPLKPIRSDEELDRAIQWVDRLIDRDDLHADEEDYLEVLADLVKKCESKYHPLPEVSEADMLRHLIEARAITQGKLAADTGIAESTISAILAGKRGMNRTHIAAMVRYFKVSPAVFIASGR